jgi:tRNA nucleotidyltransferase (CCA-adding enzyme)
MTKIYQVGGSVRDKILGVKSKDIDFAVEAESFDAMREKIISLGGKIFLETPQFLTIRANVPELGSADYVLCRKDGAYSDGRRPESVTVGNIFDDLARRDFTMNAMAIDTATGRILDPHLGLVDIIHKQIVCVGDANVRMAEDKLRAFRAVRFAVTKGFIIHALTCAAIERLAPDSFDAVSTERIREEMLKMFEVDSYDSFFHLFERFPNLGEVVRRRDIWFKPSIKPS